MLHHIVNRSACSAVRAPPTEMIGIEQSVTDFFFRVIEQIPRET
jgi:hypothetical protein